MSARAIALAAIALTVLGANAAAEPLQPPWSDYVLHCSGCHREDGGGVPGVTPPLQGLAPLLARPGGRDYLARVPGVAQAPIDDEALATLLNFVLQRFSGARAGYSAAEIGVLRERPIRDTRAARPALESPVAEAPRPH